MSAAGSQREEPNTERADRLLAWVERRVQIERVRSVCRVSTWSRARDRSQPRCTGRPAGRATGSLRGRSPSESSPQTSRSRMDCPTINSKALRQGRPLKRLSVSSPCRQASKRKKHCRLRIPSPRKDFKPPPGGRWLPRQHGVDAYDEGVEFLHVGAQEVRRRLLGDLTVGGDEPRLELDVALGRVHLRRVAVAEQAAQVLLGDGGADRARAMCRSSPTACAQTNSCRTAGWPSRWRSSARRESSGCTPASRTARRRRLRSHPSAPSRPADSLVRGRGYRAEDP